MSKNMSYAASKPHTKYSVETIMFASVFNKSVMFAFAIKQYLYTNVNTEQVLSNSICYFRVNKMKKAALSIYYDIIDVS